MMVSSACLVLVLSAKLTFSKPLVPTLDFNNFITDRDQAPMDDINYDRLDRIINTAGEDPEELEFAKLLLINKRVEMMRNLVDLIDHNPNLRQEIIDISNHGRGNAFQESDIFDSFNQNMNFDDYNYEMDVFDDVGENERMKDNLNGLDVNTALEENVRGPEINVEKYRQDNDLRSHDFDVSKLAGNAASSETLPFPTSFKAENIFKHKKVVTNENYDPKSIFSKAINTFGRSREGKTLKYNVPSTSDKFINVHNLNRVTKVNFLNQPGQEIPFDGKYYTISNSEKQDIYHLRSNNIPNDVPFQFPNENGDYFFGYQVRDEASGNNFGHKESKEGDVVRGFVQVYYPRDKGLLVIQYTVGSSKHAFSYHRPVNAPPRDSCFMCNDLKNKISKP